MPAWLRELGVPASVEQRGGVLESGMTEGAAETYERLDEYLEIVKAEATC
jgi:hypothetical protein